jgi:alkyldihydroxyacetonephosphate synthase
VFSSFRITQLYETGAAVYIYFGFSYAKLKGNVVQIYEDIENDCRDEIIKSGGSISHHHGVGKIRKRFVENQLPPMAIEFMKDLKTTLDPKNVFAINNTIYRQPGEKEADLSGANHQDH